MSNNFQGPGILWVTSRIAQSSKVVLDEETFIRWYDEDHIPEIVETSGINDAFRYIDVKKESALGSEASRKPFLAFYPMRDLEFTQGDEFKKIRVHSDILPSPGIIYDLADIDVAYLLHVGTSGIQGKKEPAQFLLVSAIEPATDASDEDVNKFYDEQTAALSKASHYIRSLRFKLVYARTNAQSRALKGLATTDEPNPEPPTWRAIHEFSAEPSTKTANLVNESQSEILRQAKQTEFGVYKLAKFHGNGKFFE
ncbi:hypothetical protein CC86DRAFT_320360 [Ophiobolus disseminans]|uniref:Uncharacterized protein n=1 Tax=Ophiobolus disseminans TaxID=1469910 RepID=A0A6A7A5Q5_9PLEO|nr:hypothetical protein CC86DRAFT_320360 [Ophiobolus disseminans]